MALKCYTITTPAVSKIEVILDFQGKYFYDPEDKQGLNDDAF